MHEMKREVYRLINQDGIGDILSGYILVISGLISSIINPPPSGSWDLVGIELFLLIIGITGYIMLRRKIIFPRVGIVRPPPIINKKLRRIILIVLSSFMGLLIFLFISVMLELSFTDILSDIFMNMPNLGDIWINLLWATIIIGPELYSAIWLKMPRLFVSAFIFCCGSVFGWTGGFFGIPLLFCRIILLVTGSILIGMGIYYLHVFMKKYPVLQEGGEFSRGLFKKEDFSDE